MCGYPTGHDLDGAMWLCTLHCGSTHTSLWLDMRDQFAEEHLEEWEAQKCWTGTLNDLKQDTEVVYRACIIKKQDNKALADSKEAAAEELPPE